MGYEKSEGGTDDFDNTPGLLWREEIVTSEREGPRKQSPFRSPIGWDCRAPDYTEDEGKASGARRVQALKDKDKGL